MLVALIEFGTDFPVSIVCRRFDLFDILARLSDAKAGMRLIASRLGRQPPFLSAGALTKSRKSPSSSLPHCKSIDSW